MPASDGDRAAADSHSADSSDSGPLGRGETEPLRRNGTEERLVSESPRLQPELAPGPNADPDAAVQRIIARALPYVRELFRNPDETTGCVAVYESPQGGLLFVHGRPTADQRVEQVEGWVDRVPHGRMIDWYGSHYPPAAEIPDDLREIHRALGVPDRAVFWGLDFPLPHLGLCGLDGDDLREKREARRRASDARMSALMSLVGELRKRNLRWKEVTRRVNEVSPFQYEHGSLRALYVRHRKKSANHDVPPSTRLEKNSP